MEKNPKNIDFGGVKPKSLKTFPKNNFFDFFFFRVVAKVVINFVK
jgi:hypothetical protein